MVTAVGAGVPVVATDPGTGLVVWRRSTMPGPAGTGVSRGSLMTFASIVGWPRAMRPDPTAPAAPARGVQ